MHNERRPDPKMPKANQKKSGVQLSTVLAALERFLASRAGAGHLPTPEEVRTHLEGQVVKLGRASAQADFAHLQMAAAELWGSEQTAFFGRVLRDHRVTDKPARKTKWEHGDGAISRLPQEWQGPMRCIAARSTGANLGTRGIVYSAPRLTAIAQALARWSDYCTTHNFAVTPTGQGLATYAEELLSTGTVDINSVGDYLERIVTGYFVCISGSAIPPGVAFILRHYQDQRGATATKTADQLVGASEIFALGRLKFNQARGQQTRGTETAIMARDGVLLMLAASIGQRSEAMSDLVFDRTLILGPRPKVTVDLPGQVLKGRQAQKETNGRCEVFENAELWDVLTEYRRAFRPVFDSGAAVFPSMHAKEQALQKRRLSNIVGKLTAEHLGARVTLHRVRDNIATEAVEQVASGLSVAAGVLGHMDQRTTERHYVRTIGKAAMAELAGLVEKTRGPRTRLKL